MPKKKEPTVAEVLMGLATATTEYFHDDQHTVYARISQGNHFELHPVRSAAFRRWLQQIYFKIEGKPPNAQSLTDVLGTLEGIGQFNGNLIKTSVRIGQYLSGVYLDLGQPDHEVVGITPQGWGLHTTFSPCDFIRPSGMLPLPYPAEDGSFEPLRHFLNLGSEEDFILVVSFLVGTLSPRGPYPILVLTGEQGSLKSSTSRTLKNLVDPTAPTFRSYPRSERDLVISAERNWILAFDNLSSLSDWQSDALCRICDKGGYATRELYSNREEAVFTATRPIILNGISDIVTRHDLVDRCIFVHCPPFTGKRRREKTLQKDFDTAHPLILGALLDAASTALENVESIDSALPRLADFSQWVAAAEPALPWKPGAFLKAYLANRKGVHRTALQSDLFANAVCDWMEGRSGWTGTSGQLLNELDLAQDEKTTKAQEWPKDATRVSMKLRRLSGFLRQVGIEIKFPAQTDKTRKLTLQKISENSALSAHSAQTEENQDVRSGAESGAGSGAEVESAPKENSNEFNGAGAEGAMGAEKHEFLNNENCEPDPDQVEVEDLPEEGVPF
jgi:putative DNA primase/helicase